MSKLELLEEIPTRPSEPEFHLADLWRILVQRRWLVVGSLVVSPATAGVAAYLTRPTFRATTLIALEQEREVPLDIAASVTRQRRENIVSIETESRLLKSRDVLERVVRKLGLPEPDPTEGTATAPGRLFPVARLNIPRPSAPWATPRAPPPQAINRDSWPVLPSQQRRSMTQLSGEIVPFLSMSTL